MPAAVRVSTGEERKSRFQELLSFCACVCEKECERVKSEPELEKKVGLGGSEAPPSGNVLTLPQTGSRRENLQMCGPRQLAFGLHCFFELKFVANF